MDIVVPAPTNPVIDPYVKSPTTQSSATETHAREYDDHAESRHPEAPDCASCSVPLTAGSPIVMEGNLIPYVDNATVCINESASTSCISPHAALGSNKCDRSSHQLCDGQENDTGYHDKHCVVQIAQRPPSKFMSVSVPGVRPKSRIPLGHLRKAALKAHGCKALGGRGRWLGPLPKTNRLPPLSELAACAKGHVPRPPCSPQMMTSSIPHGIPEERNEYMPTFENFKKALGTPAQIPMMKTVGDVIRPPYASCKAPATVSKASAVAQSKMLIPTVNGNVEHGALQEFLVSKGLTSEEVLRVRESSGSPMTSYGAAAAALAARAEVGTSEVHEEIGLACDEESAGSDTKVETMASASASTAVQNRAKELDRIRKEVEASLARTAAKNDDKLNAELRARTELQRRLCDASGDSKRRKLGLKFKDKCENLDHQGQPHQTCSSAELATEEPQQQLTNEKCMDETRARHALEEKTNKLAVQHAEARVRLLLEDRANKLLDDLESKRAQTREPGTKAEVLARIDTEICMDQLSRRSHTQNHELSKESKMSKAEVLAPGARTSSPSGGPDKPQSGMSDLENAARQLIEARVHESFMGNLQNHHNTSEQPRDVDKLQSSMSEVESAARRFLEARVHDSLMDCPQQRDDAAEIHLLGEQHEETRGKNPSFKTCNAGQTESLTCSSDQENAGRQSVTCGTSQGIIDGCDAETASHELSNDELRARHALEILAQLDAGNHVHQAPKKFEDHARDALRKDSLKNYQICAYKSNDVASICTDRAPRFTSKGEPRGASTEDTGLDLFSVSATDSASATVAAAKEARRLDLFNVSTTDSAIAMVAAAKEARSKFSKGPCS